MPRCGVPRKSALQVAYGAGGAAVRSSAIEAVRRESVKRTSRRIAELARAEAGGSSCCFRVPLAVSPQRRPRCSRIHARLKRAADVHVEQRSTGLPSPSPGRPPTLTTSSTANCAADDPPTSAVGGKDGQNRNSHAIRDQHPPRTPRLHASTSRPARALRPAVALVLSSNEFSYALTSHVGHACRNHLAPCSLAAGDRGALCAVRCAPALGADALTPRGVRLFCYAHAPCGTLGLLLPGR
eukprot:scaffold5504_cov101-Isochrysis_galbana.AAC.9